MTRRSSYSFNIDLMRIAWVGLLVALVVGAAVRWSGNSMGTAIAWAVIAGVASTLLLGPVSRRRPARSNSSS